MGISATTRWMSREIFYVQSQSRCWDYPNATTQYQGSKEGVSWPTTGVPSATESRHFEADQIPARRGMSEKKLSIGVKTLFWLEYWDSLIGWVGESQTEATSDVSIIKERVSKASWTMMQVGKKGVVSNECSSVLVVYHCRTKVPSLVWGGRKVQQVKSSC